MDRDELEETFEEWREAAEKTMAHLTAAGVSVQKVEVDVEALLAWCRKEGIDIDGSARSRFVVHTLTRKTK